MLARPTAVSWMVRCQQDHAWVVDGRRLDVWVGRLQSSPKQDWWQVSRSSNRTLPSTLLFSCARADRIVMRSNLGSDLVDRESTLHDAIRPGPADRKSPVRSSPGWGSPYMRSADPITWAGKLTAISQQGGARSHPDRSRFEGRVMTFGLRSLTCAWTMPTPAIWHVFFCSKQLHSFNAQSMRCLRGRSLEILPCTALRQPYRVAPSL